MRRPKKKASRPIKTKIRALYEASGLSKKEIADSCKVTVAAVKKWLERDSIPPEKETLLKRLAESGKRLEETKKIYLKGLELEVGSKPVVPKPGDVVVEAKDLEALAALATLDVNQLVAEIQRRGWEVSLRLGKKGSHKS